VNSIFQDLRYAGRSLRRRPAFTAVAVLTLALGIGGTAAVLSLTGALFSATLPIPQADRVVAVTEHREEGGPGQVVQYPDYVAYRDGAASVFGALAAVGNRTFTARTGQGTESMPGAFVSGNYFRMLRVEPALGRYLTPEDDRGGAAPVVVLSHRFWQNRLDSDPGVVGRTLHLNGQPTTVVGVAGEGFRGSVMTASPELWVPIATREILAPELVEGDGRTHWLWMQGRLADGVDRRQARAALTVVGRQLSQEREERSGVRAIGLTPAGSIPAAMRSEATTLSGILLIASMLVLLIASINVAGMLLARAITRRREMAIRLAIGAGASRLVRQLLTESALLFLLGGAAGVVLAYWLVGLLAAPLTTPGGPLPLPLANLDPAIDGGVLVLSLLVALGAGVLAGIAPAIQSGRSDLVVSLKGTPSESGRSRLRSALVVGQVAICFLLLMATGLLMRSLQEAARVDLGFEPAGVLTGTLDLARAGYDGQSGRAFYRDLADRLERSPGVMGVSFSDVHPLAGSEVTTVLEVAGGERVELWYNPVSRGYFETLGIPLRQGRVFGEADREEAPPVAVVNESFIRVHSGGASPIGRTIRMGGEEVEIVGVVGDTRWSSLDEDPFPFAYRPLEQDFTPAVSLLVRFAGEATAAEAVVQRELHALDPDLPLLGVTTHDRTVREHTVPQRIAAYGAGAFGVVGLLLAVVGLYGLLAYTVGQRTREIGIRMALGARAGNVAHLVLRHGATLMAAGAGAGILASLWVLPRLGGLLFGVTSTDPAAFMSVLLLLLAVGLLAAYLPARRAARVDPMIALRAD